MILHTRALFPCREGEDEAEFSEYLRGIALGSYTRNHSLIRLGRDVSFWNPQNEPTLHRLAVFLHEYLHFIHNYSTVAGLYDFFVQLRLARIYCNTVDGEGKSHGEVVLSLEAQKEATSLLEWRRHLRGSVGNDQFDTLRQAKNHPPLVRIDRRSFHVSIGPQTIEAHGVNAVFDVSSSGTGLTDIEVWLGSEILMEGCAIEAECLLYENAGASPDEIRNRVPAYPYLTARAVFEGLSGFSPTSWFLCRLCVLALQSTDPGDAFVQIAEACKTQAPGTDEAHLIDNFLSNSKVVFQEAVNDILKDSLQLEVQSFEKRGVAGKGIKRMSGWANDLFHRRLHDDFFELLPVEAVPDLEAIVEMFRSLPACPIVQEIGTATDSQELLYFSEIEVSLDLAGEIGAAQSLFHLIDAHMSHGRFSETSRASSRACPFFKACRAPLAATSPEICSRRPWESFSPATTNGCWYGAGVACSRGRPDL